MSDEALVYNLFTPRHPAAVFRLLTQKIFRRTKYRTEPDVRPPGAASLSGKSIQIVEIPLAAMAAGE